MNTENSGNLQKTIAVIIIAAIALFFIMAVVAQGFDTDDEETPSEEDVNQESNDDSIEPPNEDETAKDDQDAVEDNTVVAPPAIVYKSYLTGLEISEDSYPYQRLVYICDSKTSLYGASLAELIIEIPCDNGKTRYAVYSTYNENLGKIGAIAPTKAYINDTCRLFGGIVCAYGTDDTVSYNQGNSIPHVDLSKNNAYYYRENISSVYTRYELVNKALQNERIDTLAVKTPSVPFVFSEEEVIGKTSANVITIPYSDGNVTSFVIDETTGQYRFIKNGKEQYDMLSGDKISFDNIFVLFADSITYEMSDGIETVMDTVGGGVGYYMYNGRLIEFQWICDDSGELKFIGLNGAELKINAGNSYIAYYKASNIRAVTFE